MGLKWVYKIKNDRRYRERLCVLGYHQISGIDYDDIHAPVLNEVTLHLIILTKILSKWKMIKIDVEGAFQKRKLDEFIIVNPPKGLEESEVQKVNKDEVLKLESALYGIK